VLRHDLTPDTYLRLVEPRDAEELYAVIARNRAHLSRWMPWVSTQTLEGTREFIQATRRQLADDDGLQTAVVHGGRIAGMVGFHFVDWRNRSTTIGYWLAEDAQGRGIMTAAVRALVDHAFGPWRLNRVAIHAAPGNARSRAIPLRLGFTEEGTLRADERLGDIYLDSVVYAVLAAEWPPAS
jgi:ribosomal-protein-serine acetyltransferase